MTVPIAHSVGGWEVQREPGTDIYKFRLTHSTRDRPLEFGISAGELRGLLDAVNGTIDGDGDMFVELLLKERH